MIVSIEVDRLAILSVRFAIGFVNYGVVVYYVAPEIMTNIDEVVFSAPTTNYTTLTSQLFFPVPHAVFSLFDVWIMYSHRQIFPNPSDFVILDALINAI